MKQYKIIKGCLVRPKGHEIARVRTGETFTPTETEYKILKARGMLGPVDNVLQQDIFDKPEYPKALSPGRWELKGGQIFRGREVFAKAVESGKMTFDEATAATKTAAANDKAKRAKKTKKEPAEA